MNYKPQFLLFVAALYFLFTINEDVYFGYFCWFLMGAFCIMTIAKPDWKKNG